MNSTELTTADHNEVAQALAESNARLTVANLQLQVRYRKALEELERATGEAAQLRADAEKAREQDQQQEHEHAGATE